MIELQKLQKQLKNEYVYRITPNQCFNLNTKHILTLEMDMQTLFEANIYQSTDALPMSVDADRVFIGAPYIMYKQFQLDVNFKPNSREQACA